MKIEVIIPTYNGYSLLSQNLNAVLEVIQIYSDTIVTIVDDGSKEEERKKLQELVKRLSTQYPFLKIVQNQINRGFGSNVNSVALSSKSEYLVLLNSDVVPEKKFLNPIFDHFLHKKGLFAIGFMDKSIEADITVLRGRGIGEWSRGLFQHRRGEVNRNDTFWVSGGSGIFKTDLFKQLKGFDSIYDPFYWEDIDLSYRAQKKGYSLLFEPKSVVIHHHAEGAIQKQFKEKFITKIAYRNQFIFIWKNITDLRLTLLHILWLPIHIGSAIKNGNMDLLEGFFLALLRLPKILERRAKVASESLISDRTLLSEKQNNQ